ncbi:MAG TPA: immunoglobulin domain-containing protein, partial [Candidatus Acidoferrales bacterium]|nr:immunoglobulin domain-containing protein [Candidatus Acidoferrales bacterium]
MNPRGLVLLVVLLAIVNTGCSGVVSGANNSTPVGPSIMTQPTSQTVPPGQTATFSVGATGTAPLSYQWRKNGVAISGATSSS